MRIRRCVWTRVGVSMHRQMRVCIIICHVCVSMYVSMYVRLATSENDWVHLYVRFVNKPGQVMLIWPFWKHQVLFAPLEKWVLLKTLHPGRVPEGTGRYRNEWILEAIPEGFRPCAKPCIPEWDKGTGSVSGRFSQKLLLQFQCFLPKSTCPPEDSVNALQIAHRMHTECTQSAHRLLLPRVSITCSVQSHLWPSNHVWCFCGARHCLAVTLCVELRMPSQHEVSLNNSINVIQCTQVEVCAKGFPDHKFNLGLSKFLARHQMAVLCLLMMMIWTCPFLLCSMWSLQ